MITSNLASPFWAILPNYADKIYGTHEKQIEFHTKQHPEWLKGGFSCNVDINDQAAVPETFSVSDGVGVLPIAGMVIPKSDFFTIFFGGFAALDILERDFRILLGREDVHTIVLDIDSPGGNAFGVQQFANLVFDSRNIKSIISVTSGMMASAAMWIGAAAHKTFITGDVTVTGSIGTVTTHTDISEFNKRIGINQTEIAAGKFKRMPSSLAPLDDAGREVLQNQVNEVNAAFLNDIGKFKNIKPSAVNKMAEGKTFIGSQAIKVGLIDGLLTMDQLLKSVSNNTEIAAFMTKTTRDINFNSFNGGQKMTLIEQISQMKTENVDLYNAMIEKGKLESKEEFDAALPDAMAAEHAKGVEVGEATGKAKGIIAERERISSLTELLNASNKDLVEKFIADGETTAPEAAVEILKAQNKTNSDRLGNLKNNSPDALNADANDSDINTSNGDKKLTQLVTEYMAEKNCTKGEAISACAKLYPEAENDFIQIVKKKKY